MVGFPGVLSGKELPANEGRCKRCEFDPWVGKIPLEEGTVTHSSILAGRIPWTEEPGRLQAMESQEEKLKQFSTHAPYLVCEVAWEALSND